MGSRDSQARRDRIEIGLVNNMPDTALEGTERQFRNLLSSAAGDEFDVALTFYSLPDVPRSEAGRQHVAAYRSATELWNGHIDGVIVTGTEPVAADLRDEPYWKNLSHLLDWAAEGTHAAVWSCLAAQAAVLHTDGITRRRLADKCFGVFECLRSSNNRLADGFSDRLKMPHSRWNDIPVTSLEAHGYDVLLRSEAGADAFAKYANSLFLYFQGHPEYEAETLLLEYRRDIKRFLRRERETYPLMPVGYFDAETTALLNALEAKARSDRREVLISEFPTAALADKARNTWLSAATRVYRNWLAFISDRKRREKLP